jgi:chaperone modulatory protein CbpM
MAGIMKTEYSIIALHQGSLADEDELSLMQVSRLCRLSPACVIEMVHEGILEPSGNSVCAWRFPFASVERICKVVRFQNDLAVNLAGAALALDLLEEIAHLEAMLQRH